MFIPREAQVNPFPSELTTPPVTKMYLDMQSDYTGKGQSCNHKIAEERPERAEHHSPGQAVLRAALGDESQYEPAALTGQGTVKSFDVVACIAHILQSMLHIQTLPHTPEHFFGDIPNPRRSIAQCRDV